jgi:hypothetical protein
VWVSTGVGNGLIEMSVGSGASQWPTVLVGGRPVNGPWTCPVHVIHGRYNEWCDVAVMTPLADALRPRPATGFAAFARPAAQHRADGTQTRGSWLSRVIPVLAQARVGRCPDTNNRRTCPIFFNCLLRVECASSGP